MKRAQLMFQQFVLLLDNKSMERYPKEVFTYEMFSSIPSARLTLHQKPILNRKPVKAKRYAHTNQTLKTIEEQVDSKIQFKLQKKQMAKGIPGVGQYDISVPIVKPAYQTYDKGNDVVLVKINHIGGTSSFRSEHDRFYDKTQSINASSQTPGPGSYSSNNKQTNRHKNSKPYSESYDIIQDMIMQHRQTIESIPNYCLPPRGDYKYNGMPKHLQDMYHKLKRAKINAEKYRETSLQIDELRRIREENQTMPIKSVQENSLFVYLDIEQAKSKQTIIPKKYQKFTQTMYRFQEEKKKQSQRTHKIKIILQNSKQRSFSVDRNSIKNQTNENQGQILKQRYNKNMVNMIFGQKNAWRKHNINRGKYQL